MENKKSNAVYRATRKYEKQNYYCVNIRFPKEWETEIKGVANGKIQAFIISAVGEKIGREYKPKDLIAEKKKQATKNNGEKN